MTTSDRQYSLIDVKARLERVKSIADLCALNEWVEEMYAKDQQQLVMSDAEWDEYTLLFKRKHAQIETSVHGFI